MGRENDVDRTALAEILVPKLHLGMNLSWQLYCLSDSLSAWQQRLRSKASGQVRSQVQLGNEAA
jgi:hypothetical protein